MCCNFQLILFKEQDGHSVLGGPADLSLASAVFGLNRPRNAPCSNLWPPFNLFFSSHNLLNQPLNCLQSPGVPTPFLSLTPYYQSTMSSQFHQNDSAEVEALSTSWSPCICGPCTYFSLGFCFHSNHVALESWRGHFLCGLAKEKCKGAEHCLKMQNQCSGCTWTCRSSLG